MTEHYPLLIDFELHRAFYRVRSNSIGRDLSGIMGTIDAISASPSIGAETPVAEPARRPYLDQESTRERIPMAS